MEDKKEVTNSKQTSTASTTVVETVVTTTPTTINSSEVVEKPNVVEFKKPDKVDDNNDMFITENDTFDIIVNYYADGSNKNLVVETVDSDYDPKKVDIKSFSMTFKYPSQGDFETIMARTNYKSLENMNLTDMIMLETTRAVVLMKKWSLKRKLTMSELTSADPKIVKAVTNKIREKIGSRGLI